MLCNVRETPTPTGVVYLPFKGALCAQVTVVRVSNHRIDETQTRAKPGRAREQVEFRPEMSTIAAAHLCSDGFM